MKDIRNIMTGNENWSIWGIEKRPAITDFVVLDLVADNWDSHTWSSLSQPTNGGILHPNGAHGTSKSGKGVLRLEDLRAGIRYFELHGPFSTKQDSPDYILGAQNRWRFFEIDRNGQKREVS